jgi:predicted outer membrane protein
VTTAILFALATSAVGQEVRRNAQDQERQPGVRQQNQDQQDQQQRPGQATRESQRVGQSPGQRPGAQPGQQAGGVNDQTLAAWLIIDNQGEVELAEFAQQKAQSEEVKEFAQMMTRDHQQFIQKLQQSAGQRALGQAGSGQAGQTAAARNQPGAQANPQDAQSEAQRNQATAQAETAQARPGQEQRTAAFRPGEAGGRAGDIIELKQQLGQKHTASLREALGRYQGADFDKAFMHHMVMAHLKMRDTLQVFGQNASGELRTTLNEGLQTTQQHLQQAQQIAQQLDRGGSAGQQGRQPQREQPQRQQPQREQPGRTGAAQPQ